eukprot:5850704-Karenia_brevis.AAC.1
MAFLENESFLSPGGDRKYLFYTFHLPKQWLSSLALSQRVSEKPAGWSSASTLVTGIAVGRSRPSAAGVCQHAQRTMV